MLSTSSIKRFKSLSMNAINSIQDKKLRAQAKVLKNKQDGFTLLELLVVVAILAIIGGAMISSMDGQEAKAARGVATASIAGVENGMRIYTATQGLLPNDLESLTCLDSTLTEHPATLSTAAEEVPLATWTGIDASKYGGISNLPNVGGGIGKKIAEKFNLEIAVTDAGEALIQAGITKLRYAEGTSCDTDVATGGGAHRANDAANAPGTATGLLFPSESLADMNIPAHGFEDPRDGANRNRGRGFSRDIEFGATADATTGRFPRTPALMVWEAGTGGYNNTKVGGQATDILVGLGLGQASTAVGVENSPFAKAPFYGDLGRDKYPHYVLLVKVGENTTLGTSTPFGAGFTAIETAEIVAVVDSRGDFLDEEFAEFTGQKK